MRYHAFVDEGVGALLEEVPLVALPHLPEASNVRDCDHFLRDRVPREEPLQEVLLALRCNRRGLFPITGLVS